jgi:hypothetical protein
LAAGSGSGKPPDDKTAEPAKDPPAELDSQPLVFDWVVIQEKTAEPATTAAKIPAPAPGPEPAAGAAPPTSPPPAAVGTPSPPALIERPAPPGVVRPPSPPPEKATAPPPAVTTPVTRVAAAARSAGPAVVGSIPPLVPPSKPEPRRAPPAAPSVTPSRLAPAVTSAKRRAPGIPRMGLVAAGLLILGAGGFFALRYPRQPRVDSVSPPRVSPGQLLTIHGKNFASPPQEIAVRFDGRSGRIVQASGDQIQVEVPADISPTPGRDAVISLTVTTRGSDTAPLKIAVYQPPEVQTVAPDVAMPGDEVVLSGRGWGSGARVFFGTAEAEVLQATPQSLRVKVPALAAPGPSVPVVVSMGGDRSQPSPLLIGRLPLLTAAEPRSVAPGDVLNLKGKGFGGQAVDTTVQVGGKPALVVSRSDGELKVVVPLLAAAPGAETQVEVRVPGSEQVAKATVNLAVTPSETLAFRFIAQPLEEAPGHDRAVLVTELGPAFVVSGSKGRSAAERALQAQRRLNEAATVLATTAPENVEVRNAQSDPVVGIVGRNEVLLEVAEEDAVAYNEEGRGLRGNAGRRATRGRLAAWWLALVRDLAALLLRGEPPRYTVALTPEARFLGELHDISRRISSGGVSRKAVEGLRPEARQGLRTVALKLPRAVPEPGSGPAETGDAGTQDPLPLEGTWSGTATEDGVPKFLKVTFAKQGGTFTYEKPLTLTFSLFVVKRPRVGEVQFAYRVGGGARYYWGTWDGEKLSGSISSSPDGKPISGSFELRR